MARDNSVDTGYWLALVSLAFRTCIKDLRDPAVSRHPRCLDPNLDLNVSQSFCLNEMMENEDRHIQWFQ